MTDTPKTLAEELGNIVPEDHCEHDVLIFRGEVLEIAEQHEARWAAERAELQLRADVLRQRVEELRAEIEDQEKDLEAFRALAKRAAHKVKTHFEHAITDDDRALAKLAPKENAT